MLKISNYFYIFSKITTSFVLLILILIMGYALLKSYNSVDKASNKIENDYLALSELTNKNNLFISKLNNKITQTENSIGEIKTILDGNSFIAKSDYENIIQNIISSNQNLQKEIKEIKLLMNNFENKKIFNSDKNNNEKTNDLLKIIIKKYKEGESVKKDIDLLKSFYSLDKEHIFEKLYLIEFKKFYGLKFLKQEFELSCDNYVNSNFLTKNKSSVINFLFKFISVRPSNLSMYENDDLNILMNSKKYIEMENFKIALDQIKLINNYDKYFSKWIKQVNNYLEFINTINKVKKVN